MGSGLRQGQGSVSDAGLCWGQGSISGSGSGHGHRSVSGSGLGRVQGSLWARVQIGFMGPFCLRFVHGQGVVSGLVSCQGQGSYFGSGSGRVQRCFLLRFWSWSRVCFSSGWGYESFGARVQLGSGVSCGFGFISVSGVHFSRVQVRFRDLFRVRVQFGVRNSFRDRVQFEVRSPFCARIHIGVGILFGLGYSLRSGVCFMLR